MRVALLHLAAMDKRKTFYECLDCMKAFRFSFPWQDPALCRIRPFVRNIGLEQGLQEDLSFWQLMDGCDDFEMCSS